jgi:hypothetical protein
VATGETRKAPSSPQVSLSPRGWTALAVAFVVITALLGLTAITLISQRQRTVLLNKQISTLLDETTLLLKRAGPALDALPQSSSTVASRARLAADLVAKARPLVAGLRASNLPQTLGTAGQLLQSIAQPGALAHTLANLDVLASAANQAGLVPRFVPLLNEVPALSRLISQTTSLESSAERADLVSRAVGASNDVATMVRLQSRTLAIQKATLRNGRSTRALTSQMLATANRIMALTVELLDVARQTLAHTANLDRKVP